SNTGLPDRSATTRTTSALFSPNWLTLTSFTTGEEMGMSFWRNPFLAPSTSTTKRSGWSSWKTWKVADFVVATSIVTSPEDPGLTKMSETNAGPSIVLPGEDPDPSAGGMGVLEAGALWPNRSRRPELSRSTTSGSRPRV